MNIIRRNASGKKHRNATGPYQFPRGMPVPRDAGAAFFAWNPCVTHNNIHSRATEPFIVELKIRGVGSFPCWRNVERPPERARDAVL
jgi:hypothetical protein